MSNQEFSVYEKYESQVRSYCRSFPTVFTKAKGSLLYDEAGAEYIDFLSCAGALNYGHNNAEVKSAVMNYLDSDGLVMSLDMHSAAKSEFLSTFNEYILAPRHLTYKLQFTSPTGTSVVESAVKLARKYTGRHNVVTFTNAFHGMSGVSLGLTGNRYNRQAYSASGISRMPYDGYLGKSINTLAYFRKMLEDGSSGLDIPAAVIVETVQGEGGLNVARVEWLQELRAITEEYGILLIVDDIQAGCGRTGNFFSFERAAIKPDVVCLSKSIGAIGFPFAVLLFKPEYDVWSAGEDNGTFRGNNLAFVASATVIKKFWSDVSFMQELKKKEILLKEVLGSIACKYPEKIVETRGIGFMQGLVFRDDADVPKIIAECFRNRLVIESCGDKGQVLKVMPPLNIDFQLFRKGLSILERSIKNQIAYENVSCEAGHEIMDGVVAK